MLVANVNYPRRPSGIVQVVSDSAQDTKRQRISLAQVRGSQDAIVGNANLGREVFPTAIGALLGEYQQAPLLSS
jgi:hypothetical protein